MENATTVANEVIETVAEEAVEKIGVSTIITGACAATGAVVMIYGLSKGAKWLYGKVKSIANSKDEAERINEEDADFDEGSAED